jgi:hypothetical protein
MVLLLSLLWQACLLPCWSAQDQPADDPVRLLQSIPLADPGATPALRRRAGKLLAQVAPADREESARKLIPLLAAAAPTPEAVQQLLGPPQQTCRQVVYRRYLEQWTYDLPVPLCVTWQASPGNEMRLEAVHALSGQGR